MEAVVMHRAPDVPDIPRQLLTGAQLRVVVLLAEGMTYPRIAAALGIAPSTVRVHVNAVARSLSTLAGVPAGNRVRAWAQSADGRTYLGQPHVRRRAEPPVKSNAA
jgi:DNA-binding NarL/FixJ family response regulator